VGTRVRGTHRSAGDTQPVAVDRDLKGAGSATVVVETLSVLVRAEARVNGGMVRSVTF